MNKEINNYIRSYAKGKSFEFTEWSKLNNYTNSGIKQDFVTYGGSLYACICDVAAGHESPDKDTIHWKLAIKPFAKREDLIRLLGFEPVNPNITNSFNKSQIFSAGIDLNNTRIIKVQDPENDDDAATKQYVDTKIEDIPIEKGTGENSTIQSSRTGIENKAISENAVALGSLNIAGTKAYKWSAINFNTKTITLVDIPSGIVTGDRLSIVNKNHYDDCCQVVSVSGKNIVVDSLPFTVIESDSGEDAQTIFVVSKPDVGNVDLGQCAFAEGGNTMATQMFSHAEGYGTKAIGQYSHAEGRENKACYAAHAEGRGTVASGNYSHSEGNLTTASGERSHAEGLSTTASGHYSHSEGRATIASGECSHAEGFRTTAGSYSHAEGADTKSIGGYSHAEGRETQATGAYSHAEGRETQATGANSHAEGYQTKAMQFHSHAEGFGTIAKNYSEHAEGSFNVSHEDSVNSALRTVHSTGIGTSNTDRRNAVEVMKNGDVYINGIGEYDGTNPNNAESLQNVINGNLTFTKSDGYNSIIPYNDDTNKAYGKSSIVLGHGNTAGNIDKIITDPADEHRGDEDAGYGAFASGLSSIAKGRAAHSEGEGCTAEGAQSHAEGNHTTASGKVSHAEGSYTTASGEHSHAEGNSCIASGNRSHAEGDGTKANGDNSHAEGKGTEAVYAAHAEGENTLASGMCSHAEGSHTIASGLRSHAEGDYTSATNRAAHSEGARTIASGVGSHVEGIDSKATNRASHAEGLSTITNNEAEHAQGKYNKSNTGTIHSVGIGTSDTVRKNAVEVMQNGDVYVKGVGNYQGDNPASATPLANFLNSMRANLSDLLSDYGMDKETIQSQMSELDALARGAQRALVYTDYSKLVTALNAGMVSTDVLPKGQSIYIQQLDVPDLWVSNFRAPDELTEYTYTNDDDFLEYIKGGGWIGCHQLSLLETAKVDLSNTASKTEVTTLQSKVAALNTKADVVEISNYLTEGAVLPYPAVYQFSSNFPHVVSFRRSEEGTNVWYLAFCLTHLPPNSPIGYYYIFYRQDPNDYKYKFAKMVNGGDNFNDEWYKLGAKVFGEDLQETKQDKLTDEQIANIAAVPNKVDLVEISSINAESSAGTRFPFPAMYSYYGGTLPHAAQFSQNGIGYVVLCLWHDASGTPASGNYALFKRIETNPAYIEFLRYVAEGDELFTTCQMQFRDDLPAKVTTLQAEVAALKAIINEITTKEE